MMPSLAMVLEGHQGVKRLLAWDQENEVPQHVCCLGLQILPTCSASQGLTRREGPSEVVSCSGFTTDSSECWKVSFSKYFSAWL